MTDLPLTNAQTYPISTVENINSGSVLLATFTDPNPLDTASGISATVDWGDSSGTFPAVVTLIGAGSSGSLFEVTGSHTYTTPGTDTVSITVTTLGGATTTPSPLTLAATVADAPITASGTSISGIEGSSAGSVVIATFSDADPKATVANFTSGGGSVVVNWGDGSTATLPGSDLSSSGSANGVLFTVTTPAHLYKEAGHYQLTVTITDSGGSVQSANGSATIADAALTAATNPTVSTTEAVAFPLGPVVSFSDGNTAATSADYTYVTIDWGDGTPQTTGSVVATATAGTFNVDGTHVYQDAGVNGGIGHYTITVNVHDIDGSTVTLTNTANVTDVALVVTGKLNPASDSGVSNTDNITNVVQPNFLGTTNQPNATISLYATLTGSSTPVLIGTGTSDASGDWSITSDQALANGSYAITSIAVDSSGNTTSANTTIVSNLVIDTVGPKVTDVVFNRLRGNITVSFQDNGGSGNAGVGLNLATVSDANNYQLVTVHHPRVGKYRVNVISVSPGTTTGTQTATLTINGGHYVSGGWYFFTIRSVSPSDLSGVQDIAGNALDGEFYGYYPSGNNVNGGNYVVQLTAIHHVTYAPASIVGRGTPVSPPGSRPDPAKTYAPVTVNPSKFPKHSVAAAARSLARQVGARPVVHTAAAHAMEVRSNGGVSLLAGRTTNAASTSYVLMGGRHPRRRSRPAQWQEKARFVIDEFLEARHHARPGPVFMPVLAVFVSGAVIHPEKYRSQSGLEHGIRKTERTTGQDRCGTIGS